MARSVTTCAKVSVTSAKYQVDRRSAGSAISSPAPAATTMPAGAATQNDHFASIISSAVE